MKTWFKFLRIAPALLFAALLALGISSATAISAGQYKELRAINGWHLALLFLFPAVLYSIFFAHRDAFVPLGKTSTVPSGTGQSTGSPVAYSLVVCLLFWAGWFAYAVREPRFDSDKPKEIAYIS